MLDGVVTDGPEEVGVPLGMSDAGTAEIGAVVWPPGGGLQGKGGGGDKHNRITHHVRIEVGGGTYGQNVSW